MRTLPFFSAILFLLAGILPALAQKIIHVPADQTTVQAGINAANSGDTVLVAPGTYTENIDFLGKAITVTSSDGPSKTILDGGGHSATVRFHTGETRSSVVSGFTIRNGSSPTDPDVYNGGGIGAENSAPSILNNTITSNRCNGILLGSASALIQGNQINSVNASGDNGYCIFPGAGIAVLGYGSPGDSALRPVILQNVIENNTTGEYAAGIFLNGGDGTTIQNNTIRDNGRLYSLGSGIAAINTNTLFIIQNQIYGNSGDSGGGINLLPPGESAGPFIGILEGNTIAGNLTLKNFHTDEPNSSQVYLEGNLAQYVLVNNIIIGNSSTIPTVACGTTYNYLSYTPLVLDHNDIYNPSGPTVGGACSDQTGTYGNISADPLFQNAAQNDFHLLPGSPARDIGTNSAPLLPATDFSNNPRIQDSTGLGHPVVDLGVFEASGQTDAVPTTLTLVPSTFYPYEGYLGPGNPFTLTAQLASAAGTPFGPVTFLEDNKPIGTLMVDATGAATLTPAGTTPGLHAFLATYSGHGAFPSAVSVKFYVLFPKNTPTLTLTSAPNPSALNSPVLFSVHIATPDGSTPGPITLTDNSTNTLLATVTPDSSGNATFTTSTLALGSHPIAANFNGNDSENPASATITQTVIDGLATTTTLTSSLNPSHLGNPVTFTAQVTAISSIPTGSVVFMDRSNVLGTVPLDAHGDALFITSTLSANNIGAGPFHFIFASFQPTSGFRPSVSTPVSQVVLGLPTLTTVTVSPTSGTTSTTFTLTATVYPIAPGRPTGTVLFYTSSATSLPGGELGSATLTNGVATLTTTGLLGGANYVTAVYLGDTTFDQSTSNPFFLTVTAPPTSLTLATSANPIPALAPVTITAHLLVAGRPAPAGIPLTLTFAGTPIPLTTDSTGAATYIATNLLPGHYTVTLAFAGTATLQPATPVSFQQTIGPNGTVIALTATPNPAYQHQTVTLTATVVLAYNVAGPTGTTAPTGQLTFLDGATPLATLPLTPTTNKLAIATPATAVTFSTSTLAPGLHLITGTYTPDSPAFFPSSSIAFHLLVNPQDFTLTPARPSLTLATGHHTTTTLNLASVGSFAGPVTLTCLGPLPQWLTCELPTSATALAANATVTIPFNLDTDAILGYRSQLAPRRRLDASPGSNSQPGGGRTALLAGALPVFLLCLRRGRRPPIRPRISAVIVALCLLAALCSLAGCGDRQPSSTAPGTYTLVVQAAGQLSGTTVLTTHTTNITLTVTQ